MNINGLVGHKGGGGGRVGDSKILTLTGWRGNRISGFEKGGRRLPNKL